MPPSLPTYRFHTPPPLPFIHSCSASHYLYLKFRSRLTHQKHMLAAYLCMCRAYRSCRVHASIGTCDLKHTDSHYFTLKADMWVHCEMGPRCTPEIPESRARMHVVLSRTARSQEFRLSSQACLSDWSGSEPMTGPALRNSKSTLFRCLLKGPCCYRRLTLKTSQGQCKGFLGLVLLFLNMAVFWIFESDDTMM